MMNDPEHGAECIGAALRGDETSYGERGRLLIATALSSMILANGEAFLKD
jgi:hypothetical protein